MGEETQQAKHLTINLGKKKEKNHHGGRQLWVVWILTRNGQQGKGYRTRFDSSTICGWKMGRGEGGRPLKVLSIAISQEAYGSIGC